LQNFARKDKVSLPYFSKTLGRWLFIRPQPKDTRRTPKPFKIGRFVLIAVALYCYLMALKGAV